ncbi:AAA family ATPase [Streptomyces morookaense]|uniref:helix-turn-helix transcriptional regulator n=1 Tax=Streptomyces morookaense TaxID=1970 RepID=UPI0033C343BC
MAVTFETASGTQRVPPRIPPGRSTELNTLLRQAARTRAGAARAVLVRGPAGMGRTSLLSAVAEHLPAEGVTVRRFGGRPGDNDGTAPRRAVDVLLAPHSASPSDPAPVPADAHADRLRLHRHLLGLLSTGPLALVVDDAQWCDETSLRCLDFVLRRAAARPLFVLLSQRTECEGPGTPVLAELLAHDRCALLELGPLDPSETARMIDRTLGGPVDDHFVRRCTEVSGGNPLVLGRLLAALRGAGVRPDAAGLRRLGAVYEGILASMIPDFLAGQPRHVRRVAIALAVLGRGEADLLGALCGVTGTRVESALGDLRRAEAVLPGAPAEMRDAVREAVLGGIAAPTLQQLRVRAARVLSDAGRPATEVAGQLVLLDRLDEPWMLAVLRDAIAESPSRAATRAAVRCLRRALESRLTAAERKDVHVELARASVPTAPATALWHLRRALATAAGPREQAPIAVEYGMAALGTRCAPDAVRALGHVLDGLTGELGTDPAPADRELHTTVASALLVTAANDRTAMSVARERAAAWPVPQGDSPAERQLLSALSTFAALEGRPADQAAALARRALRVEEAAPAGWWVLASSVVLSLADAVDEAQAGLERSLSNGQLCYAPWMQVAALAGRSLTLHGTGDVTGALHDARAAVALAEQTGMTGAVPMAHIALGNALLSQGEAEEARTVLDRIANAGGDLEGRIWEWHQYLYARGRVQRELGDLEGALDTWQRCGRSLDEAGVANPVLAPWWLPAADTLVRLGRTAEAAAIAEEAQVRARRWGTPRAVGLGLLATATAARGRTRLQLLAEGVDALAASPARLELAKAEYLLGRELLGRDDARGARSHLRRAIELATRCGYHVLAALARELLVTAGGRMPQLATSPLDSLTESERRVAALAQGGVSNKKIAEALFITTRTVEMHLTNVYRKLAVRGRADLPGGLGMGPGPALPGH